MPADQSTATHFVLQYQRDTTLTDLVFTAQACADLTHWKAPGRNGRAKRFSDTLIASDGSLETRQATVPRSSGNCFIRMRITRP